MSIRASLLSIYLCIFILAVISTQTDSGTLHSFLLLGAILLATAASCLVLQKKLFVPLKVLANYVDAIRHDPATAKPGAHFKSEIGNLLDGIISLNKHLLVLAEQERAALEKEKANAEERKQALNNVSEREKEMQSLLGNMNKVSCKARDVAVGISSEVQQLSQLVAGISTGVEVQRSHLDNTSEAMGKIVQSVQEATANTSEAANCAQASREKAQTGAQEVQEAVKSIEKVKETTLNLKEQMLILGEKAANIGKVMGVINEVADQTNLLALNAAIEAARAGEAGRGFAVVADEVRKLAEKTMHATQEVEDAVLSIQEETKRNIEAVDRAADYTVESAQRASAAGEFMVEIVQDMQLTANQLENIATASNDQFEGSRRTNEALGEIRQVAGNTAKDMLTFTSALVKASSSMEELDIIIQALASGDLESASSSGKLVQWVDKMNTGIELIDAQHQMLCNYLNTLYRAMQTKQTGSALHEIIDNLVEYTVNHFSTEEQFFTNSAYPDTKAHKEIHRNFEKQVADFAAKMRSGEALLSMELLEFLKDWLLKHINGTDHAYIPYVKEAISAKKVP